MASFQTFHNKQTESIEQASYELRTFRPLQTSVLLQILPLRMAIAERTSILTGASLPYPTLPANPIAGFKPASQSKGFQLKTISNDTHQQPNSDLSLVHVLPVCSGSPSALTHSRLHSPGFTPSRPFTTRTLRPPQSCTSLRIRTQPKVFYRPFTVKASEVLTLPWTAYTKTAGSWTAVVREITLYSTAPQAAVSKHGSCATCECTCKQPRAFNYCLPRSSQTVVPLDATCLASVAVVFQVPIPLHASQTNAAPTMNSRSYIADELLRYITWKRTDYIPRSRKFRTWESCQTMRPVAGFSRGSPVPPAFYFPALLHTQIVSSSSAFKASMLRAVQIPPLYSTPRLQTKAGTGGFMRVEGKCGRLALSLKRPVAPDLWKHKLRHRNIMSCLSPDLRDKITTIVLKLPSFQSGIGLFCEHLLELVPGMQARWGPVATAGMATISGQYKPNISRFDLQPPSDAFIGNEALKSRPLPGAALTRRLVGAMIDSYLDWLHLPSILLRTSRLRWAVNETPGATFPWRNPICKEASGLGPVTLRILLQPENWQFCGSNLAEVQKLGAVGAARNIGGEDRTGERSRGLPPPVKNPLDTELGLLEPAYVQIYAQSVVDEYKYNTRPAGGVLRVWRAMAVTWESWSVRADIDILTHGGGGQLRRVMNEAALVSYSRAQVSNQPARVMSGGLAALPFPRQTVVGSRRGGGGETTPVLPTSPPSARLPRTVAAKRLAPALSPGPLHRIHYLLHIRCSLQSGQVTHSSYTEKCEYFYVAQDLMRPQLWRRSYSSICLPTLAIHSFMMSLHHCSPRVMYNGIFLGVLLAQAFNMGFFRSRWSGCGTIAEHMEHSEQIAEQLMNDCGVGYGVCGAIVEHIEECEDLNEVHAVLIVVHMMLPILSNLPRHQRSQTFAKMGEWYGWLVWALGNWYFQEPGLCTKSLQEMIGDRTERKQIGVESRVYG
ncbi:hypothetical protein PR048_022655 [Dryococelus australis]|uniref:Uncharacterized protein n=1 Tax=Dryococelus australis TaxID=614101 RepID=A0ABQ9H1P8_9NEOP|nr:hypothetical protein PR048_022655 [Dryococelus australis]